MKKRTLFVALFFCVVCLLLLSLSATASADVWIDNTVDKSVTTVTGIVHLTGAVGTAAGYGSGKIVYSEQVSVTYGNVKPAAVQTKIDEASTMVRNIANDLLNNARGEFHVSTTEKKERDWDYRRYDTVPSNVVINGTTYILTQNPDNSDLYEYSDGSGSVSIVFDEYNDKLTKNNVEQSSDSYTINRTHIASGDYGKVTTYFVEANGWIEEAESDPDDPENDPETKPDPVVDQITVSGGVYLLDHSKLTAVFTKPSNKNAKKLSIPKTVSANGKTYKVTEIKSKACKGMKKLTTVTIGANVTKIGAQAFAGCKKLGKITIKNAKMAKKGFGSKCLSKIRAKAIFKVPKKMVEKYKDWILKKGKAPKDAIVKK